MEINLNITVKKILKRIRQIRKYKGLSHGNMAYALSISPSAYNKVERSQTLLSVERLLKIAEILEISIYDIFELKDKNIFNQKLAENSIDNTSEVYQENKEVILKNDQLYNDLLQSKENSITQLLDEISFLRDLFEKEQKKHT